MVHLASSYFHKFKKPNQKAVHKKIRNHICTTCGHAFAQKNALRQHMFIHTGESDHKCKFCGKMFATNYRLVEHEVNWKQLNDKHVGSTFKGSLRTIYYTSQSYWRDTTWFKLRIFLNENPCTHAVLSALRDSNSSCLYYDFCPNLLGNVDD